MTDPETGCGHALRFSDVCNPCFRAAEKRAEDAEAGLRSVDAILARRSAIDDEPTREAKILKAIKVAATADDAVRERDEARADHQSAEKDARTLDAMLKNEQAALWRGWSALAASQALVRSLREALTESQSAMFSVLAAGFGGGGAAKSDLWIKFRMALDSVAAALAESPAPPDPEATTYHPTAVAVTLTGLIRSHLKNCLRTIKGVDCPDLLRIVDEWANKIARGASPSSPEPADKEPE